MAKGPKAGSPLRFATSLLSIAGLVLAAALLMTSVAPERDLQPWVASLPDLSHRPPGGFEDVVDRVKPAVFGVSTRVVEEGDGSVNLEDLLHNPNAKSNEGREFQDQSRGEKQPRLVKNEGSGFFISPDGYAVTANHVVENGESVEITTNDGKRYPVKVVGRDPETDIALLKVDAKKTFPFVEIANKPPRIGEWVIAVGNPFGLGGTVTAGIVSAGARDISADYNDYIQIDAPVNQGNSGGPSFDASGKVIGVNSAIVSPTGGSVGIGFAIPAKTVRSVVPQLKQTGMVVRGWMGVHTQDVTPELANALDLKPPRGVLVAESLDNSPAAKAGIRSGDVINTINGEPVQSSREFSKSISEIPPGTTVTLGLIRKGRVGTVKVTLIQLPSPPSDVALEKKYRGSHDPKDPPSRLGLTLSPGESTDTDGVVVTDVEPGGIGADRGLQTGDIIVEVDGKSVHSPSDVDEALDNAKRNRKFNVLARVESGDSTHYVAMPAG